MVLTVHFIQDELISGEVQLSQVQVGDAAVGLAEEKTLLLTTGKCIHRKHDDIRWRPEL